MEETKQNNDKFVVLGTKVSHTFARIFGRICRKKGIKKYLAIQQMAESFVRYTDDMHNLSPDMERLMMCFEHMEGWKDAFNLADASAEKDIKEAIYLLTAKGRKGARAVMVHRPFFGQWSETVNIQTILERVVEVLMPERYRRLRQLAIEYGCSSILDLLDFLIDHHSKDSDVMEFRRTFEDCRRSISGKEIEYGQKRKSVHHQDIDGKAAQRIINFTPDDRIEDNSDY